jgi:hypothetical protein
MAKLKELVDKQSPDLKSKKGLLSKATKCELIFDPSQLKRLKDESNEAFTKMTTSIQARRRATRHRETCRPAQRGQERE